MPSDLKRPTISDAKNNMAFLTISIIDLTPLAKPIPINSPKPKNSLEGGDAMPKRSVNVSITILPRFRIASIAHLTPVLIPFARPLTMSRPRFSEFSNPLIHFEILSNIFSKIFKKYKNKNLITNQTINYFFIEIIILILASNVILCDIKNIITITLIILLILFTFSFIYNHKTQKRFEKRSDYEDLNKESEEIDYAMNLRLIGNFLGKKTLFFVFITFIFVSVSLTVGEFSAKNQTAFYKVNGRDDVVGIVIYGERIIAKGLSSDRIQNEIIFFDICNDTKIEILPLKSICKKSEENFEIHEQVINVSENNFDEDNP